MHHVPDGKVAVFHLEGAPLDGTVARSDKPKRAGVNTAEGYYSLTKENHSGGGLIGCENSYRGLRKAKV